VLAETGLVFDLKANPVAPPIIHDLKALPPLLQKFSEFSTG
jgi:hypothetical protein